MRFVRAGVTRGGGARLQEWRSERTGRVFEVDERDAYAAGEALEPGAPGYLTFVGGAPVVTRQPGDPPPHPGSRAAGAGPGPAVPPRSPARNRWLWLLVAAAVVAVLLRLLR